MNNSEAIVGVLENAGIRWVFGVPSGPVLPFIEALRKSSVEFVLTASETSAGFMASAVGSLTGVPGVCVSTVGPGATNLTTGVGCAWLDRAPVVAITCNVASPWLQRRMQMRIDHHELFRPLTKGTIALRQDCAAALRRALLTASEEPPGPVHLDFPEDVAEAEVNDGLFLGPPQPRYFDDASTDLVATLSAELAKARHPLVVTGLSFTRCKRGPELIRFIERQQLPFVTTMHAKGFLPESHPHWCGVIGRARRSDIKLFTDRADLIIAIGYDPIEINYEDWAGKTPIAHISNESAEESSAVHFVWNRACDLDRAIEALNTVAVSPNEWSEEDWRGHRSRLERALRPSGGGFAAHHALDVLRDWLPAEGILAYDVGAHTHQIATQWRTELPRTLLATNGWSSMGYGMPAAYAAKLVYPDRPSVCVVGDGGFQMTAGELALARRLNLAVPVVVLNDGWLGLMKVKQERRNYPVAGVRLGSPPESPAHYFGVPCRSAKSTVEFAAALRWADSLSGPCVIEAFIDAEAYSATVFD